MEERRTQHSNHVVGLVISAIIVILIVGGYILYLRAQSPIREAHKEAVTIARRDANLTRQKGFYWYNRNQIYYTVYGLNKKNQDIYVLISKQGKVRVIPAKNGINASQAKSLTLKRQHANKVTHAALGLYKGKLVWELTYYNRSNQLSYDLIRYKNGNLVKSIQNV